MQSKFDTMININNPKFKLKEKDEKQPEKKAENPNSVNYMIKVDKCQASC